MKLLTAIASLLLTTTIFAQESGVSVELFTGFGGNHTNGGMIKFSGDVQYRFGNSTFAGFQSSWGFNGNRTISRNVTWNGTNSLIFGYMSPVSEHVSVQPYIGLGYQISMQTDYLYEDRQNLPSDLMSKIANKYYGLYSDDPSTQQRYAVERHTTIGVPVGVNFLIHKKTYGLALGTYLFASKYPEIVLRAGIAFGKLH
jgi:hypothetical protein